MDKKVRYKMSRFKDQLQEIGTYADKMPEAELVFRVPIRTLRESDKAERRLIEGEWRASLEDGGETVESVVGTSGEHSLEYLCRRLRQGLRSP